VIKRNYRIRGKKGKNPKALLPNKQTGEKPGEGLLKISKDKIKQAVPLEPPGFLMI
jgi:hypothetical protein